MSRLKKSRFSDPHPVFLSYSNSPIGKDTASRGFAPPAPTRYALRPRLRRSPPGTPGLRPRPTASPFNGPPEGAINDPRQVRGLPPPLSGASRLPVRLPRKGLRPSPPLRGGSPPQQPAIKKGNAISEPAEASLCSPGECMCRASGVMGNIERAERGTVSQFQAVGRHRALGLCIKPCLHASMQTWRLQAFRFALIHGAAASRRAVPALAPHEGAR